MCEANCPVNELRRLKRAFEKLDGEVYVYQIHGMGPRLQWVIDQLEAAGEGQKCFDLEIVNCTFGVEARK